jgi:PhzF family phenazine biosynthesis protein
MQGVAATLRQSETAFLLPARDGWLIRWFTPRCEVPLCGHATLAAVLALDHWGALEPGATARFHSRSGSLPVGPVRDGGGGGCLATIELPGSSLSPCRPWEDLQDLLRRDPGFPAEAAWTSPLGYRVALLPAEAPLAERAPAPDRLPAELRRGLVLMQPLDPPRPQPGLAGEAADYQLRFLAPGLGIDEDPVTGSAHALVAGWWMARLGRPRVVGWQCSDRPGGMVCEASSSGMIRLSGCGCLLWDGSLRAPPWRGCGTSGASSAASADPLASWIETS